MGSEGSIPGGVQGQPVSERDFCSGKSTVLLGPLHHLGTLVGRQMGPNKQPRLSSTQCHQDSVSNSGSAVRLDLSVHHLQKGVIAVRTSQGSRESSGSTRNSVWNRECPQER